MNATATTNRAVPEWLETPTHQESVYTLMFVEADGGSGQHVDMTRDEFDALKRHLAEMRGFAVEAEDEEAPEPESGAAKVAALDVYRKEISELADDQIASRLGDDDAGGWWMEPLGEDRMVFYMMLRDVQDEKEKGGTKPRLLSWADTMQRHARRIRATYNGLNAGA